MYKCYVNGKGNGRVGQIETDWGDGTTGTCASRGRYFKIFNYPRFFNVFPSFFSTRTSVNSSRGIAGDPTILRCFCYIPIYNIQGWEQMENCLTEKFSRCIMQSLQGNTENDEQRLICRVVHRTGLSVHLPRGACVICTLKIEKLAIAQFSQPVV